MEKIDKKDYKNIKKIIVKQKNLNIIIHKIVFLILIVILIVF